MIINRDHFLRLCLTCNKQPSQARRSSENQIFKQQNFEKVLNNSDRYKEYFFAYKTYEILVEIQSSIDKDSNNTFGKINYGNALRYGKYAVTSVALNQYNTNFKPDEIEEKSREIVNSILDKWLDFEKHIERLPHNSSYFQEIIDDDLTSRRLELNYTGYYKGRTINHDLESYFN